MPTDRVPRCPKCRSLTLGLTEVCEELGHIEQDATGSLVSSGTEPGDLVFEPGFVLVVRAQCRRCGHGWCTSLRQITDHPRYPHPEAPDAD